MQRTQEAPRVLRLRSISAAFMLAATLAAAPGAFANNEEHARDSGPGCAPERPAIAHHAGGVVMENPLGKNHTPPIPCATRTGWRTSEISIAVTNAGTILFQPAVHPDPGLPIGAIRSVDRGESWEFIDPAAHPPRTTAIDMNMAVDRQTGRAFWTSDLQPPVGTAPTTRLDISDDDGKTWFPSSPTMPYDHTQVFTGQPTRSLRHLMHGYPNVVYVAVSGGFTCSAYNFCGTHITKSLDGGRTFGPAVAIPYPPECPSPGANPTGGYGLAGVVGRDGTVYLPFTPCQRPYVAITHDEGDTWELSLVADTTILGAGMLPLGMDQQGNLYAAFVLLADRLPYLTISRDHGLTWSTPLMIAAPGVKEAAFVGLVAGKRGQVAVAYYGSKNAPQPFPPACRFGTFVFGCTGYEKETWDTYITESWNALEELPLFWSATLNDPAQPTFYGFAPSPISGLSTGRGNPIVEPPNGPTRASHLDYFGMTLSPDGTPWVGFFQACPFGLPVAGNPNCQDAAGGKTDGVWGMLGRLVRVGREADEHDEPDDDNH